MEPRSPTLQVDSLPAEPQGKANNTGVGSLSLLQRIVPTQELNRGLRHCWWICYQLSYHIYICVCVCVCVCVCIYLQILAMVWRNWKLCALLVGRQIMQALWKTVWWLLKKIKNKIIISVILFPSICPKKSKSGSQRDICLPMFTAALFTIEKIWKQHKSPFTDE